MRSLPASAFIALSILSLAEPDNSPAAPERKPMTYRLPWESIHRYTGDTGEAHRRMFATGWATTADVFSITGKGSAKGIHPLATAVPLRGFGGLVESKPAELRLNVTPEEDEKIKAAAAENTLFVIYYEGGW